MALEGALVGWEARGETRGELTALFEGAAGMLQAAMQGSAERVAFAAVLSWEQDRSASVVSAALSAGMLRRERLSYGNSAAILIATGLGREARRECRGELVALNALSVQMLQAGVNGASLRRYNARRDPAAEVIQGFICGCAARGHWQQGLEAYWGLSAMELQGLIVGQQVRDRFGEYDGSAASLQAQLRGSRDRSVCQADRQVYEGGAVVVMQGAARGYRVREDF